MSNGSRQKVHKVRQVTHATMQAILFRLAADVILVLSTILIKYSARIKKSTHNFAGDMALRLIDNQP